MRRRAVLSVLAAAALLLGACTTGAQDDTGTDRVEITMSEFAFDPDPVTVPAGREVTLALTNDGDVRHELMAGRDPMPDDDGGYLQDLFAGVDPTVSPASAVAMDDHDAHAGFMVQVEPGETVEVTFTLPADRSGGWEIGCFEPGHYEAGMHAQLTVTG
jgi:uncharacterized cupredoxin-like copper-binding protein